MSSDKRKILDYILCQSYGEDELNFSDILRDSVIHALQKTDIDAETYIRVNENRLWGELVLKQIEEDRQNGIVPIFSPINPLAKTMKWLNSERLSDRDRLQLRSRPAFTRLINGMNSRDYEALACALCRIIGAQNILLTTSGNEGGIDFIATISFSNESHFLFGVNGPLRIIGQCKKYTDSAKDCSIRDFCQVITDVRQMSPKVEAILPTWFRKSKGPIIGWHICHSGHQAGAISRSRQHGIILSSTRDIVEVITRSKMTKRYKPDVERTEALSALINTIKADPEINMDLH